MVYVHRVQEERDKEEQTKVKSVNKTKTIRTNKFKPLLGQATHENIHMYIYWFPTGNWNWLEGSGRKNCLTAFPSSPATHTTKAPCCRMLK